MKARLVPLHLRPEWDDEFAAQVKRLRVLFREEAEILEPVALGDAIPVVDAVVFPQMLGDAYRQLAHFKALDLPILIMTSEFGTMAMWDWEIASYLRTEGVDTIAPYNLEQAQIVCRALVAKRELHQAKFLAFQDKPGEAGFQPSIFKRFYWWEDECAQRMHEKFGVTVVKKSFQALGAAAQAVDDREAEEVWSHWKSKLPIARMPRQSVLSALKLYIAVRRELDLDPSIQAVGINCLNESHFSDTTPCLAWNMLYEERNLIWGCEGDTVSMLTKHILDRSLGVPIMMTNLYPFLMGQSALKHERIPHFPLVDEPDNHVLAAHCGYLGVLPQSFSTEWRLKKKVLAIVDNNATAIDARLPVGDLTLAKLDSSFNAMTVAEGALTGYAQYPGSDCLNGAVIRVRDGHKLMAGLPSHHSLLLTGHNLVNMGLVCRVFELRIDEI